MYNLHSHIVWLVITYAMVLLAMLIDFITGVHKARQRGEATTSRGFKKTCDKAAKYFLPMFVLTCLDLIGCVILPVPAFTMFFGAFNIFCEVKSVFENTHTKLEIKDAEESVKVIIKNKDDIANLVLEALKKIQEQQKEDTQDGKH